ncbi:MAG: hypothetical protein ACI9V1_002702 [Spirosomataceae bacterium]|jgi:hypothetical protein
MFFVASCDKGEQFNIRPENATVISDDMSIENGVLKFTSKDSYNRVLESIKMDTKEFDVLKNLLLKNGFEPLEMLYSNLDEKTINPILETQLETQVVPDNLKSYLKIIPLNDNEFELVETVSGSWLKLILNKNLNFAIGDGLLTINDGEITLIENYKRPTSSKYSYKIMESSNERNLRSISSSSNDNDYSTGGRNYRLQININTPNSVYLATWGFNVFLGTTEVELKHQRRTLWTWWQFDTSELSLATSNNGWGPNRQNPSLPYGWYDYFDTLGPILNTSRIIQVGPDLRWLNSTGTAKCIDGQTRTVSASDAA